MEYERAAPAALGHSVGGTAGSTAGAAPGTVVIQGDRSSNAQAGAITVPPGGTIVIQQSGTPGQTPAGSSVITSPGNSTPPAAGSVNTQPGAVVLMPGATQPQPATAPAAASEGSAALNSVPAGVIQSPPNTTAPGTRQQLIGIPPLDSRR